MRFATSYNGMDDNSRQSSVDDSPTTGYAEHVEHVSGAYGMHGERPPEICAEDRAKIYAVFQMQLPSCAGATKKASAARHCAGVDNRLQRNHTDDAGELTLKRHRDSLDQTTQPPTRKQSGAKRFGLALKNLFMNEQPSSHAAAAERRARNRRDSWDNLYKSKDVSKVRPHDYDSAYLGTL